jgi:hypothetical protein
MIWWVGQSNKQPVLNGYTANQRNNVSPTENINEKSILSRSGMNIGWNAETNTTHT